MAESVEGATVRLSFHALPVHVRTARLVAVTVARRAGWGEEQVESVRQAVGEAFALALQAASSGDTLTLELDDRAPAEAPGAPAGLRAWVSPVRVDASSPAGAAPAADDALPRAVLASLTDDLAVEARGGRPALRLSWSR